MCCQGQSYSTEITGSLGVWKVSCITACKGCERTHIHTPTRPDAVLERSKYVIETFQTVRAMEG